MPDQLIMKSNILKAEQVITSQKEHKQFTAFDRKTELQSSRVPHFEEGGGYEIRVVAFVRQWKQHWGKEVGAHYKLQIHEK